MMFFSALGTISLLRGTHDCGGIEEARNLLAVFVHIVSFVVVVSSDEVEGVARTEWKVSISIVSVRKLGSTKQCTCSEECVELCGRRARRCRISNAVYQPLLSCWTGTNVVSSVVTDHRGRPRKDRPQQ